MSELQELSGPGFKLVLLLAAAMNLGTMVADHPFDDESKADAIILSSDGVKFHVHKLILSLSSSFFHDMFATVSSGPSTSGCFISTNGTFTVTEDSCTIDCLLRMVYPGHRPTINQPSLAGNVWKAARKYRIAVAKDLALERLRVLMPNQELGLFAIACRMQDEEEAKRAVNVWLREKGDHRSSGILYSTLEEADFAYAPEMESLSAGTYLRLLHYLLQPRRGCRFCPKDKFVVSQCEAEVNIDLLRAAIAMNSDESNGAFGTDGWDVIVRSSDGVDFRVHRLVLHLSTADGLIREDNRTHDSNSTPTYSVSIDSSILRVLLYMCYPLNAIQFESVSTIVAFLRPAIAYDLTKVTEELKRQLFKMVDRHPLRLYFVGVHLGWDELTSTAARYTVGIKNILDCIRGIDLLRGLAIPELEEIPASALYELLKYHKRAQNAIVQEVTQILPSWRHRSKEREIPLAALSALGMPCAFGHISVPIAVTGSRTMQNRLEGKLSVTTSVYQLCQRSKLLGDALKAVLDGVSSI